MEGGREDGSLNGRKGMGEDEERKGGRYLGWMDGGSKGGSIHFPILTRRFFAADVTRAHGKTADKDSLLSAASPVRYGNE